MSHSYNLMSESWIPVIDLEGKYKVISLEQALSHAEQFGGLSAPLPHTNAALMRLLLAILARVYGPSGPPDWNRLWQKGSFASDQLTTYLNSVWHRFDLFDANQPFFQQRHPQVNQKSVGDMFKMVAGGDTFTLFDHTLDEDEIVIEPAEAALLLLTTQSFGLAGLCHPQLKLTYTDAPCSRATVFFIEGETLFETLLFNMLPYNRSVPFPQDGAAPDRLVWEVDDPYLPIRNRPLGYLDYLTWPIRRIQFIPEEINGKTAIRSFTTAPGLNLAMGIVNPMYAYKANKKGEMKVIRLTEGRSLWRDSTALFTTGNSNNEPPQSVNWRKELMLEGLEFTSQPRMVAYGMSSEPGKAKIYFYRREGFVFSDKILAEDQYVGVLNSAIEHAEQLRSKLWGITSLLANNFLAPDSDSAEGKKANPDDVKNLVAHWGAEGLFWSQLEEPFNRFMNDLPADSDQALKAWDEVLKKAFRDAYNTTALGLGTSQKALRAAAKTGGLVQKAIKDVLEPRETGGI